MANITAQNLLRCLRSQGPTPSSDVVETFGISRPTLSRRVKELGDSIVTIGKGRATQLAARHERVIDPVPLYQVSEIGKMTPLGHLIPLMSGEHTPWYHRCENAPSVLREGKFKHGLYPGWPWFLEDLRPTGFLGRAFGKRMAGVFQIDDNPENWSDLDLLNTLVGFGWNLHGNYVLGDGGAYTFFQEKKVENAEGEFKYDSPERYSELAQRALGEDEAFGSSAGGEQPKFTGILRDPSNHDFRAVIVKFSPKLDTSVGQRWADLLNAEHLANQILSKAGFSASKTRIFSSENRVFLESVRFDRIDLFGRKGLVSLRSLDAAFVGVGKGTWANCARRLSGQGLISDADKEQIIRLNCFGDQIGNTDMHFGNLSFFLDETFPLKLAPVYDMLPMRFRPSGSGEIIEQAFRPTLPKPEDQSVWEEMVPIAQTFWQHVADCVEISDEFRSIAENAISSLERIHQIATA